MSDFLRWTIEDGSITWKDDNGLVFSKATEPTFIRESDMTVYDYVVTAEIETDEGDYEEKIVAGPATVVAASEDAVRIIAARATPAEHDADDITIHVRRW